MDFVTVARITKSRGIRGELLAEILTDFPERFSSLSRVRVWNVERTRWEILERHWFHKGRIVLKFKGRDFPEQATELIGTEVQVPKKDRVLLPKDSYYHSDLIGCQIVECERSLGMVTDVFEAGPSGSNLVVESREGGELMIPMVREFIREIDVGRKTIRVELLAGLNTDI